MDIETKIFLGILALLIFSCLQLTISYKISWRRLDILNALLKGKNCYAKDTIEKFTIFRVSKTHISVETINYPYFIYILDYNNVCIPDLNIESKKIFKKLFGKKFVASINSIDPSGR